MCAFKKNLSFNYSITSSQIKYGNTYLDDNIFHAIVFGTIILLEEDEHSYHHLTFIKTFLAQNIFLPITVLTKDLKNLSIPDYNRVNSTHHDIEKMLIAWRYNNLQQYQNENKFDMSKKMDLTNKNFYFKNAVDILTELESVEIILL